MSWSAERCEIDVPEVHGLSEGASRTGPSRLPSSLCEESVQVSPGRIRPVRGVHLKDGHGREAEGKIVVDLASTCRCMKENDGRKPDPFEPEFCAAERQLYKECRADLKTGR